MEDNKQENFTQSAIINEDPNSVTLSDGRIVIMRETNGADEAGVAQILGDRISMQGAGVQVLVQANALKSIESIDGKQTPVIRTYSDYLGFARQFKTKDLQRITKKYAELNLEMGSDNPLV